MLKSFFKERDCCTMIRPLTKEENRGLSDLNLREIAALVPLCVFMLWIGLKPETFLKPSRAALEATLAQFHQGLERTEVAEVTLEPHSGQDEIAGVTTEAGR